MPLGSPRRHRRGRMPLIGLVQAATLPLPTPRHDFPLVNQ
jgi:hypothetical protein